MRILTTMVLGLAVVLGSAACGAAAGRLSPGDLGVTARDAYLEGRTRATTWDGSARLRWMEGVSISSTGMALPGSGFWRLHYTAPNRASGLVVTVGALQATEEERSPTWPEGFTIGDRSVSGTWVDSPEVMARVLSARGTGIPEDVNLLLVPETTLQWVVTIPGEARRWRLDAATGQVITP
jgi:hypothetical protein